VTGLKIIKEYTRPLSFSKEYNTGEIKSII
jgi:hypothetical protein